MSAVRMVFVFIPSDYKISRQLLDNLILFPRVPYFLVFLINILLFYIVHVL